jgi:hypothetical protein
MATPLDRIVALRIGAVGARVYDEVRQVLVWELSDRTGHGLVLEVPFTPLQEGVVRCLEGLDPAVVSGGVVIGRLERHGGRRVLFPFTVHPVSGTAIHLGFVKAGQPTGAPGTGEVPNQEPDFAEGPEPEDASSGGSAVPACPPELARWLDRVDEVLIAVAEGGVGSGGRRAMTALPGLAGELRRVGLNGLATGLSRLSAGADPGTALLRAVYISSLLRGLGTME